tara:strand:- start:43351 stop:44208 length:858 start_codon:yes stop_codon:yes gene_type:complete
MDGHPRGVLSIVNKIETIVREFDKKDSERRIKAIREGFRRRTSGKTERQVKKIALKCLHCIRNIIGESTLYACSHDLNDLQNVPIFNADLCRPIGPTEEEWELARQIVPDVDYTSLRCRIARIEDNQRRIAPIDLDNSNTEMHNVCSNCGNQDIVYDCKTDDDICTQCGLACRALHSLDDHWQTSADILNPMISEPIGGHRQAQKKADYLAGMRCPNGISRYTKWMDYVASTTYIKDTCSKLRLGQHTEKLACQLYGTVRCGTDRLEKHSHTIVACILVARRCVH